MRVGWRKLGAPVRRVPTVWRLASTASSCWETRWTRHCCILTRAASCGCLLSWNRWLVLEKNRSLVASRGSIWRRYVDEPLPKITYEISIFFAVGLYHLYDYDQKYLVLRDCYRCLYCDFVLNSLWLRSSPWSWVRAWDCFLLGCEFNWAVVQYRNAFHTFILLSRGVPGPV